MKAIYINDCQYDFVDNQGRIIHSFKLARPITFLDIRKLQLASMIKGDSWCSSMEEIESTLSYIHVLNSYDIGIIVNFFELFDIDSNYLVVNIPRYVWDTIYKLQHIKSDMSAYLIEDVEKNDFLAQPNMDFIKDKK